MSIYYVGHTTQFTHSETDSNGNAIPQELGRWSCSNPAVASITQGGLASWLAPGETEITFVIQSYRRSGALHATVHSPIPASLASTPSSLSVSAGSAAKLAISGLDSGAIAISDLIIDSAASSDVSIADVLILEDAKLIVLGIAAGSCSIHVESASATLDIAVTVTAPPGGVASVFGRTGAVVKHAGDYAVADVIGAASTTELTNEANTRDAADTSIATSVVVESIARANADSSEATARAAAVSAEASARANADALLAPLASPALSGNPTAPTQAAANNSTRVATTAYADGAVSAEATARSSAVSAEATARATAVSSEASARAAADALLAPLASPTFTGTPAAPTAAPGTNTQQLASTAFVAAAVAAGIGGGAVSSVFGRTGAVVKASGDYAVGDVSGAAPLASPTFTGVPIVPTAAASTNTTQAASTAYADAAVAVEAAARAAAITAEASARSSADALLAPLASPTFTGTPIAPTPTAADNTTKIATTAFVHGEVATEASARATSEALLAPLASPTFTGHPVGVTEAALNNSTRLASTAYADAAVAVEAARAAAAEALLAPLASPTFTGNPIVPTQSAGNSSTRAASTAFVAAAVAAAPVTIGAVFGDAQTAPAVNATVIVRVAFACTITQSDIFADASGSAVVNVYTSTNGTSYTSIVASAKPTLSSSQKTTDSTLTGWTTAIAAGTFVKFVLESVTTCKLVSSALTATKS